MNGLIERATALLVALSLVLSSTVPTIASAQSIGDILGRGGTRGEASARKLNASQIREAREAQAIFQGLSVQSAAFKDLPQSASTETYDPANKTRAAVLKQRLEQAVDAYQDAKTQEQSGGPRINAEVLSSLRDAVFPFVRFLDNLSRKKGRAPPRENAAVQPGTVRTFDLPGYCMDSNLASPKTGEAFRLTPAKDLLPPELGPLLQALMRSPDGHSYTTQGLVWKIRNAYRNGQEVHLDPQVMSQIEARIPGATVGIDAYNRKTARTKTARGLMDAVLPGMRQNVSSLLDAAESASPQRMVAEVKDRLATLDAMPVQGESNPLSSYTQIAPGVIAHSTSPRGGHSSLTVEIANTTNKPYIPDFTSWVGTSERNVQHMAIQNPVGYGGGETEGAEVSPLPFSELLSLGLDFSILGNIKAGIQAILGYDLVTGEPRNRWLEAMAIIPVVGQLSKAERVVAREVLRAKPYGLLKKELAGTGTQAHHLSQDAAYGSKIPHKDGLSIGLDGDAIRQPGTPHYDVHEELEKFWQPYRKGGEMQDLVPTNKQYLEALEGSLKKSGMDPRDAKALAEQAGQQHISAGLHPNDEVPRVPNRINQRKRP